MNNKSVKLYHNEISTCAQKVRIALAEKGVEFEGELLDLTTGAQYDPAYLKLNPNGVVPTLVHGDDVIIESNLINEYIDEAFTGPALRPDDPVARARMRLWAKSMDDKAHPHTITLSFAIAFRQRFLAQTPEERDAFLSKSPNAQRREHLRDLLENGTDSDRFPAAVRAFNQILMELERSLEQSSWLAGDEFSLADIGYTPYITRLEHLALEDMWADKPNLSAWYQRVKSRPSYAAGIDQWLASPLLEAVKGAGEQARSTVLKLI